MNHFESFRSGRGAAPATSPGSARADGGSRARRFALALAGVLALAPLYFARDARAQAALVLDTYRSAAASTDGFGINQPSTPGHLVVGGQVHVDYANDPLVIQRADATQVGAVVSDQVVAQATVFLGLFDSGLVFVQMPFNLMMSGQASAQQTFGSDADSAGPGDLSVGGRWRVLGEREGTGLAVQAAVQVPSASWVNDKARFIGSRGAAFLPQVIGEYDLGRVHLLANAGVTIYAKGDRLESEKASSSFVYGLGANVPVTRELVRAYGELLGNTDFSTSAGSALELLLGVKLYPRDWMVGLAAGPGIQNGVGSPDVRVVGAVGYMGKSARADGSPEPALKCVGQQEDRDGFEDEDGCPDPDNDNDGILDARDKCPNDAEDRDGFQDEDGCPDLDNDKDGIPDAKDRCPQEAEDFDKFEDEDGCPDLDNDKDGVPDSADKCPDQLEDMDKFEDEDGCPDPDNDKDGIPDAKDACPNDAETVNGIDDDDGCPDRVRVDRDTNQLTTLEPVFFKSMSAEILERSFDMLKEIAALIVAHPELGSIDVEGHTDVRGRRSFNLKLSQDRADSVRNFLIDHGVPSERVHARGFGAARPIMPGDNEQANEVNRRVEFHLAP